MSSSKHQDLIDAYQAIKKDRCFTCRNSGIEFSKKLQQQIDQREACEHEQKLASIRAAAPAPLFGRESKVAIVFLSMSNLVLLLIVAFFAWVALA